MKKNFFNPELDIQKFNYENIVTTSGETPQKTNLDAAEEYLSSANKVVKITL